MNESLVVVIYTVDRPKYLGQLLESLDAQTDLNFEVLAINNGGPATTRERLEKWAEASHIKATIVSRSNNQLGFDLELLNDAQFFMIVGDDDRLLPHAIATLRAHIRQNPSAAMFAFSSRGVGPLGHSLPIVLAPRRLTAATRVNSVAHLLRQNGIVLSATLFRTCAVAEYFGVEEHFDFCGDWLLSLLASATGPIHASAEVICESRLHGGQHSRAAKDSSYSHTVEQQALSMLQFFLSSGTFKRFARTLSEEGWCEYFSTVRMEFTQDKLNDRDLILLQMATVGAVVARCGPLAHEDQLQLLWGGISSASQEHLPMRTVPGGYLLDQPSRSRGISRHASLLARSLLWKLPNRVRRRLGLSTTGL